LFKTKHVQKTIIISLFINFGRNALTSFMFIEFVNQNIWLFIALIVVFNLLILSILSGRVKGAKTISALEMPQLQRNDNCVVIDVNPSKDFATSHIPNSIL